jgi:predicted trehalose synthase
MQRRRFKQTQSPEERLTEEAALLREQAKGTPPGVERERLIRRARQAETASRINGWPALQPPE